MSLDLNSLLHGWPHENGAIKVRRIPGLDGKEKIQLRVDLGVLQMELAGRPDGLRPHNCESLLVYHQRRAERAEARGESYDLTAEQCNELQQEGIQYYHRYLSLFQLSDFTGVIRDTERKLELFSFVAEHTDPGWIMAFPSAIGVLVERGSLLSHAAIVARELGIPAVVSVPGLTRWLHDEDWVEMDGATGTIRRLRGADA